MKKTACSLLILALFIPFGANAETVLRIGDDISVDADQVVNGDYYVSVGPFGNTSMSGSVAEDMYAFGGTVTTNGSIGRDLTVVGGYAWYDAKNRNFIGEIQAKLNGKFGLGSKLEASQDFGELLDEQIKKVGGMNTPKVMRLDGSLIVTDIVDGEARNVRLTLDGIAEELMKRGQARRGAKPKDYSDGKQSTWYRFGPEITSTEKRDAKGNPLVPSIYR